MSGWPKRPNTASAAAMPIANWPTLNATFGAARRLATCPRSTPAATARIRTLGLASGRAAAHRASVREKFTVSVPCRSGIENCSATATNTINAASVRTSDSSHVAMSPP
jgi:hypothetical protein